MLQMFPFSYASPAIEEVRLSQRMRQSILRAAIGLVSCSLFLPLVAQTVPMPSSAVPAPHTLSVPALDARVDRAVEQSGKSKGAREDAPVAESTAELDQKIAAGEVRSALARVEQAKKEKKQVASLANATAVLALVNQGVEQGIPEAFRAKGIAELERGDTVSASRNLREASLRGSAEADYELAALKAKQLGMSEIGEPALSLLAKAAEKGDARAATELGLALERGGWIVEKRHAVMVEPSDALALAWMERAVLLGSEEAVFWLGLHKMRATTSLADISRAKALDLLLRVRRSSPDLREPSTGKTFAELEASGGIEEGLLAEIKRREAKEKDVQGKRPQRATGTVEVKAVRVMRIDNQMVEIGGDPERPVYNVIGFSPYREVVGEGEVVAYGNKEIQIDVLPTIEDSEKLHVEILEDGKKVEVLTVSSIDARRKAILLAAIPETKLAKKTRWRLVRYHTFLSIFGPDNRAGLKPGMSADEADEVIVPDPRSVGVRRFYFHRETGVWTERAGAALAADIELPSGGALLVKRTESGSLSLVVRGVLSESAFIYEPGAGIQLASLHHNELGATLGSDIKPPGSSSYTVASATPVLTAKGKAGKWSVLRQSRATAWWSRFGVAESDLVNLVGASAAICIKE